MSLFDIDPDTGDFRDYKSTGTPVSEPVDPEKATLLAAQATEERYKAADLAAEWEQGLLSEIQEGIKRGIARGIYRREWFRNAEFHAREYRRIHQEGALEPVLCWWCDEMQDPRDCYQANGGWLCRHETPCHERRLTKRREPASDATATETATKEIFW
jgi:hypothetical protein